MKRFYWKELLMLSAPVGVIALGLVFVKVRSGEPTSSLFSKWPDKVQISKCEVRPATPLEISQGAQFGVTMQVVSPLRSKLRSTIIEHSVREPALESANSNSKNSPETPLSSVWHEENTTFNPAVPPLQLSHYVWKETEAFNRSSLKSGSGIIEVDINANVGGKPSLLTNKVFQLDTTQIPLPDLNAARTSNFQVKDAHLASVTELKGGVDVIKVQLNVNDISDKSQRDNNSLRTVGKWSMEGHPDVPFEALTNVGSTYVDSGAIGSIDVNIRFLTKKHPPLEGAKFRGVFSVNHGWPQEVTFEYPKPRNDGFGVSRPDAKFTAKLAPLPK